MATVLKVAPVQAQLDDSLPATTVSASSVAGSALKPAPGWSVFTTIRPMASATVETSSKYSSALAPTRPTFFMSPAPAMPSTTVQKIIGLISIRTRAMKPSPSGLSFTAVAGAA